MRASSSVPGANISWPQCLNWKATQCRPVYVAAMLKGVAHVGDGADLVVGEGVDDHRRAADSVAFVAAFS